MMHILYEKTQGMKEKMKKYLSITLASMLALSSLSACSPQSNEEDENVSSEENQDDGDNKEDNDQEENPEQQYSDIDKERMKDTKTYPGSTKSGKIDDVEAIENLTYAFFDSLQSPSGTYGDKLSETFEKYAYGKQFKDLTKKQKETLFDAAYEAGMFIPYNEKALNDNDKYNIIAEALIARNKTNDPDKGTNYMVDFSLDDVQIEETEGKLPKALIPAQAITLVFYDDRTPDLNLSSIENDYLRLNGGLHMVKYKGIWYVAKANIDENVKNRLATSAPTTEKNSK